MSVLSSQNIKRKNNKNNNKFIIFGAIIVVIGLFLIFPKKDKNIKHQINKSPDNSKLSNAKIVQDVEKQHHPEKGEKKNNTIVAKSNIDIPSLPKEILLYSKMLEDSIKAIEQRPDLITIENHVKREPLAKTLQELSLDPHEVYKLTKSMKTGGYDFTKTKPNEKFIVKTDDKGRIWEFYIFPSKLTYYYSYRDKENFKTNKIEKVLKEETRLVKGEIKDSLYNSIIELDEHPNLVIQLADFVFKGGEIDFFSDCQKGDKYAIIVPRKYYIDMKGKKVFTNLYGDIEAVYYKGKSVGNVYAFKYLEKKGQLPDYYNEEAKAVKRPFLRIPFTFRVGISSGFGRRLDPVSRAFTRNHNGTDFPVKIGSPFISVARGRVIKIAYQKNGAGHYIRLRHANGYFTEFFHLSHIKKGLHVGSVVKQGEILGRTGNSGHSTGPHLHYGMMKACKKCRKGFRYIDPMKQKFTISTKDMPKAKKPAYFKMIKPIKKKLDDAINNL